MDSFLPKSDPTFHVTVAQEEFNLFHKIDRELFTRLVVGLGRDTTKSTHVMAFILLVENKIMNRNIVRNLLKWPDVMLAKLADEIDIVLDCIESSNFPYGSYSQKALPLIQHIMHNNTFTLHYFHNNRIEIINATTKLLVEVCLRAFIDIVQQVHYKKAVKVQNYLANSCSGFPIIPSMQVQQQFPGVRLVPQQVLMPQLNEESSNARNTYDISRPKNLNNGDPYGFSRQMNTNEDINCMFANLDLDRDLIESDACADAESVAVPVSDNHKRVTMDDRTIFMTFSKGYRISELEVREFFTRNYGDVVEAMFMQDVEPPEKPLYARLVIYPEAKTVIEHFLGGKNGKVKFVINGKHVWARNFFRRAPTSPNEAGTSYFQW